MIALVALALAVLAAIVAASAIVRLRRIVADQRAVLGESSEQDLVAHAASTEARVDGLQRRLERLAVAVGERLDDAERRLDGSISRTSVLRYDAFSESTGRQSSSVALLDDEANGVVFSAILQREQARLYVKPIADGGSELHLSPEEEESVRSAMAGGAQARAEHDPDPGHRERGSERVEPEPDQRGAG